MGITFFSSSQIGITENQKKILILNLNNFFSRQLKKIWTVKSLEIHSSLSSPKLVEIGQKLWYIFSIFWEYYKNDKKMPNWVSNCY